MLFVFGALLAAGSLAMSARAQSNVVYAVEYKQSTNRVGTIDLLNGNFTKISSIGTAIINDIAYCPTNGTLYGISNSSALVTFNKTNGAIIKVTNLSASSIESLAFRPSDGALFGATSSKLYTINPANGTATSVGSYGSPQNLGTGENIRFARDGNLYVSNKSTNTDIYRINTTNGAATWMGEAVGYPYLMLQNASSNMYGVFINLGSATNATPELATFNLSSFVNGGTNANGSTHQITIILVGAGTNFPANFNFSGNVPQSITNLTVPVSATGPVNQTVCPGNSVVFSTVASGTPPYGYAWLKNGSTISGQTNSSLTLANVSASDAATYSVIVSGAMGTVTNSATLTVNVPVTVTAAPVNQTSMAGGNATFSVTATGTGLSYQWLFNGSVIGTASSLTLNNLTPSQAGVYTVIVNGTCSSITNSATLTVNVPVATKLVVTQQPSPTATAGTAFATQPVVTVQDTNGITVTSYSTPITVIETSGGNLNGTPTIQTVTPVNGVATFSGLFVTNAANGVTLSFTSGSLTPATSGALNVSAAPASKLVFATQPAGAAYKTALATQPVVKTQDLFGNNSTIGLGATVNVTLSLTTGTGPLAGTATLNIGTGGGNGTTSFAGLQINRAENGDMLAASAAGLTGATSAAFNVASRAITVTAATNTRNYDGTTSAAATPTITAGTLAAGDTANFTETYNSKNVGTGKTLTPAGTVTDGNSGNNYTYTFTAVTTGVINTATLTVTPTAVATAYNGTVLNNATYSDNAANYSITGFQSGETVGSAGVTLSGSLAFNGSTGTSVKNVGTYTPTVGTLALSSANNNYVMSFSNPTPNNYVISKAALTITAAANTKTYDGSTSASATPTASGLQGSDSVSGLAEIYDTKNAGTGKTLSVSTYTVNDGNSGSNYTVSTVASIAGVINQATLTITAASNTKTYDGTTSASATPTASGLQGSDSVSGLAETYDTKNAGTGKTLSVSAYTVNDGNSGNNYTVNTATSTAGVINQVTLTITAAANTKTYDGTISAAITPTTSGLQGSDSVTGLAETYDTKNAGTGKTLSVSAYTVNDGNSGNNYTVSTATSTAGVISKAMLTITAAVNTKTYDGSTSASATPTTSGLQGSDSVTGLVETYDTKDAGMGKTLSVSAYTVNDGNGGNNYTVSTATSTAGVINKATLTITAAANTKTYDGAISAAITPTTSGLQGSDSVTGLAETYDTKHAGTGKTLSVSVYTVNDGNSGNNYTVSTATSTAGVISQAPLTITAAANTKTYDCSIIASATPTVSGLQGSDSVSGLVETYDTKNVGSSKTLSVNVYTVNDGNSGGNYTVSTVASTAGVINPAMLTVTADNKSKMCGQPNPPLTASYNGFVNSESTNVLTSPVTLATTATTSSGAGTYPITASGVAAANYTINYVSGKLIVDPPLQLSAACASVSGNNQFIVSWPTVVGQTYQLEYTSDLTAAIWTSLGTPFAGTDGIVAVTNSMSVTPQCFFRVEVLEDQ